MRASFILLLLAFGNVVFAQNAFYDQASFGEFNVGYFDTTLLDPSFTYRQYDCDGPLPLFVQVWHPLHVVPKSSAMTVGELRAVDEDTDLRDVRNALYVQMDEAFKHYSLSYSFPEWDTLLFGGKTPDEVLEAIKRLPTISHRFKQASPTDHPLLIYHHGAQGLSDENHLLAEYFASHGYIVVSSNFHWPFPDQFYGYHEGLVDQVAVSKYLAAFARTLTTSDELHFVGHSWGAQVGWMHLFEEGAANSFVSMETTIEFKDKDDDIKAMWPSIYRLIREEKTRYPLPILAFANTGEDSPFPFFENTSDKGLTCVSAKQEFAHEAYTSAFHMRYFLRDAFEQPDVDAMQGQLELYIAHLALIRSFMEAQRGDTPFKTAPFLEDFFIHGP